MTPPYFAVLLPQGWNPPLHTMPRQGHLIIAILFIPLEKIYPCCAGLLNRDKFPPSRISKTGFPLQWKQALFLRKKIFLLLVGKKKERIQIRETRILFLLAQQEESGWPTSNCRAIFSPQLHRETSLKPIGQIHWYVLAALPVLAMQSSCKSSLTCQFLSALPCQISTAVSLRNTNIWRFAHRPVWL